MIDIFEFKTYYISILFDVEQDRDIIVWHRLNRNLHGKSR